MSIKGRTCVRPESISSQLPNWIHGTFKVGSSNNILLWRSKLGVIYWCLEVGFELSNLLSSPSLGWLPTGLLEIETSPDGPNFFDLSMWHRRVRGILFRISYFLGLLKIRPKYWTWWSFPAVANISNTWGKLKANARDLWAVREPKSRALNRDLIAVWTALVDIYLFKILQRYWLAVSSLV